METVLVLYVMLLITVGKCVNNFSKGREFQREHACDTNEKKTKKNEFVRALI